MVVIRYADIGDADSIGRVQAESWRSTYSGIVPDDYLAAINVEEWSERQRRNMAEAPDDVASFVAETEGQVVGWAVGGPNREPEADYAGELYAIYLLPDHQRRGVGLELTVAIARWLVEQAMGSMILWVLAENHQARRFYERLGGQYCGERQVKIGDASLLEVAYGWADVRILFTREARQ